MLGGRDNWLIYWLIVVFGLPLWFIYWLIMVKILLVITWLMMASHNLVGGFSPYSSEKSWVVSSSVGIMTFPYMKWKIKHVPNHQPDKIRDENI